MWQSQVEIHYLIAQFDHVTVFEAFESKTFVKSSAHVRTAKMLEYLISLRSTYEPHS